MENSNGSQILDSMCSLSLPSEPPGVGNWFASYAYESPVVNRSDYIGDSVFRNAGEFVIGESTEDKEKNLVELSKTRSKDELGFANEEPNSNMLPDNRQDPSLSQIPDSSYTPSQVSEPPDIGNWFSSYIYESFVLDTNDDVKDSISQEGDHEKERFAMGENQKEKEIMARFRETRSCHELDVGKEICLNGFGKSKSNDSFEGHEQNDSEKKSLSKISNVMDSHSVFTEPPDVNNWFSSYVYESPVLSTSDEIGDSFYLEREPDKDELLVEDSDGEEEEKLVTRKVRSRNDEGDIKKVHSNGLIKQNSSFEVDEQENGSITKAIDRIGWKESPSSQNNLHSIKISEKRNGLSPSKAVEEPIFIDENSMSKLLQEFSQEARPVALNINRSSSTTSKKKSSTKLFHRTDFIEECLEANTQSEDVNIVSTSKPKSGSVSGASWSKQTQGRNDKENGFVVTRKNEYMRTEKEDSMNRSQASLLECPRNNGTVSSSAGEKDDVKRKALMETTNFQHTDAAEVTGKWRCPQKSKPNRGPPLKQLRLERWIHRA